MYVANTRLLYGRTVNHPRHLYEMWWIDAGSGRVMQIRRFVGLVSLVRIQFIRLCSVGDLNNIGETRRVTAVTRPKSGPDQLQDMLRRLLAGMTAPAPVPAPVIAASGGGEAELSAAGREST